MSMIFPLEHPEPPPCLRVSVFEQAIQKKKTSLPLHYTNPVHLNGSAPKALRVSVSLCSSRPFKRERLACVCIVPILYTLMGVPQKPSVSLCSSRPFKRCITENWDQQRSAHAVLGAGRDNYRKSRNYLQYLARAAPASGCPSF